MYVFFVIFVFPFSNVLFFSCFFFHNGQGQDRKARNAHPALTLQPSSIPISISHPRINLPSLNLQEPHRKDGLWKTGQCGPRQGRKLLPRCKSGQAAQHVQRRKAHQRQKGKNCRGSPVSKETGQWYRCQGPGGPEVFFLSFLILISSLYLLLIFFFLSSLFFLSFTFLFFSFFSLLFSTNPYPGTLKTSASSDKRNSTTFARPWPIKRTTPTPYCSVKTSFQCH